MQMGRQLFTNLVWRSNAHTAVRKTSSERKHKIKKIKKTKKQQQQNNNNNNKKQKTKKNIKKMGKPFDELLMFVVGKDSALFSGL